MTPAQTINRQTDLAALLPDLRRHGSYFTGPCPFCGGTDRFTIKRTEDGDLWHCRGCGHGKYQDAVAFLMRRDGKGFREVVGGASSETCQVSENLTGLEDTPPTDEWQIAALAAMKPGLDSLFSPFDDGGRTAWDYLHKSRGLDRDTIRRASLGYNAAWREVLPGHWLAPGIVIPAMIDGVLWYVKVRTTRAARAEAASKNRRLGKYAALKGSVTKALYNARVLKLPLSYEPVIPDADDVARTRFTRTVVIVEGEFDALLLQQFVPRGWGVVTMGSAGSLPGPAFRPYLLGQDVVRLRLDSDDAGAAGAAAWQKLIRRVEPLPPLPGGAKDVTDYWRAGGDVAAWVLSG